jgi:hypothetical protein
MVAVQTLWGIFTFLSSPSKSVIKWFFENIIIHYTVKTNPSTEPNQLQGFEESPILITYKPTTFLRLGYLQQPTMRHEMPEFDKTNEFPSKSSKPLWRFRRDFLHHCASFCPGRRTSH